ncbi:unnamed protein product [Choristocarpus tenellus]
MSNIYHTEPATHGKVLLHTSYGDIDIELWSKECPKACRNFVQLAMEGYYDNTVFHRIIPKFMVQGGDPTGTGSGGESIYGKAFRDEFHTRIKFNHRGQVAMANENSSGTNHSQFFFTLDKADHLHNKHTIFGKITGNTVFNALRMGDVETDKDDRPLEPPRLTSVEVLLNPFDDIIPRNLGLVGKGIPGESAGVAKSKKKRKGKKDFKLLSFGEEAEEEEEELSGSGGGGVTSAHDALEDIKLSKDVAYDLTGGEEKMQAGEGLRQAVTSAANVAVNGNKIHPQLKNDGEASPSTNSPRKEEKHPKGFDDGEAFMEKMRQQMKERQKRALAKGNNLAAAATIAVDEDGVDFEGEGEGGEGPGFGVHEDATEREKAKRKAIKEKASEYEALREELKAKHRAARVMTGEERIKYDEEKAHREMLSPVEQMRAKYKKRRREAGEREDSTMAKLASFTSSIRDSRKRKATEEKGKSSKRTEKEAYHGQVTEGMLYEGDESDGENWFSGSLKFKKHIDDNLRMGSDGRKTDDYAVIDPLKQGGAGRSGYGRGGEDQGRERGRGQGSSGQGQGGGRDKSRGMGDKIREGFGSRGRDGSNRGQYKEKYGVGQNSGDDARGRRR